MAIKTGEIFNSLVFGGVNSADYGIYITGEGVFNAPKRAVNMVAVPGRNGSIAIDQGHWDNIEVTYPAGTFGMDESEFATALSNFRNAIVSQIGYQRLTDTYHPDEYRMALYADGLEAEPTTYNSAGEFELKFNCKPQRWLTSGEVPVTIGEWGATKDASGEIVTIESEGGEIAKSLEVSLEPIQAGSGEPSPSNVRPISGRTEVKTIVSPTTSETDGRTYTTSLGRTVYGGTLDVVSGVLTVDKEIVDLGTLTWTRSTTTTANSNRFYSIDLRSVVPAPSTTSTVADILCSQYEAGTAIDTYESRTSIAIAPNKNVYVFDENHKTDDATAFKTAMSGVQFVYPLATPQTYQLTPQQVTLLVGENHLWSGGAITMQYGDDPNSLWNPTQYDAGPLLITDGYGTISFNEYDIEITHVPVGWVTLVNRGEKYLTTALPNASGQYSVKWNSELLQRGDTINVASQSDRAHKITFNISNLISLDTYTYSNSNPNAIDESVLEFAFDNVSFTAGTARTISNTLTVTPTGSGSSASWTGSIRYDGDSTITFSISKSSTDTFRFEGEGYVEWSNIESKSTAQAFGRPTYIDCELGEAYKIENDEVISLNKYLDLGSDLPKLSAGANDVTTDSTITELQVVPNWWKL